MKDNNWIPVTERLPEPGVKVLITTKGKLQYFLSIAWWSVDGYWVNVHVVKIESVTAWQPLPEPYKGGE